jgi:hypothetical protein
MAGLEGSKADKQALHGNVKVKQGVNGKDGKNAYQYAVEGGYTGKEKVFGKKLARIPDVLENVDKLSEDILTTASAVVETVIGKNIEILNSTDSKPLRLTLHGQSEQKRYTGKNWLKNINR